MKLKEFSEMSVRQAKAAFLLGFDCIEKYSVKHYNGKIIKTYVRMRNVTTSCDLNPDFFPELDDGDVVSVHYIINYKNLNEFYKEHGMYQDD